MPVLSARHIIGTKVYDFLGQKIGQVEDVGLDDETNAILYATVKCPGFLGLGSTQVPMAWNHLEYDAGRGRCVSRMTRQELQSPIYD
jgi:hypothetical protein